MSSGKMSKDFPMDQAVTCQPRYSLVREKHLSETIRRPNCKGIKVLEQVDELHVRRVGGKGGVICNGYQKYQISDQNGVHVFDGIEESSCLCVHCCGPSRSYKLTIKGKAGSNLLQFWRPVGCDDACWCCCGCGLNTIHVTKLDASPEENLGKVVQEWSMLRERFCIQERNGQKFCITGPNITCRCYSNITFKVQEKDGEEIGAIWKRAQSDGNDTFVQFGVTFAKPCEVEMKALLLAAAFLLVICKIAIFYEILMKIKRFQHLQRQI
ncbi:unnamed protein product [Clavelina lepadiformis]|uniref:Phospholipid scramblase n=1 Tax=Clavelina lepadiformis TaxID=159417 RepID=A0ABP0H4A7_CLALP